MSKRQTLMLLGVIVISFLFLGFRSSWDKLIAIVSGVAIIFVAYKLTPEPVRAKKLNFVEYKNDVAVVKSDTAPVANTIVENVIDTNVAQDEVSNASEITKEETNKIS